MSAPTVTPAMDDTSGIPPVAPPVVQDAIAAFAPDQQSGFRLLPAKPGESSVLLAWGVRVAYKSEKTNTDEVGWICLAQADCRDVWVLRTLYSGKTSNGTRHLRSHFVKSTKTLAEERRKRTREEEIKELQSSTIFRQDPKRLRLLVETRDIILKNQPFCAGESNDREIINQLFVKEEFQTSINAKAVARSLIELYVATKREVMAILKTRPRGVKCLTVVMDFWTCKVQHNKYLGVRVYFVDDKWKFRSVILGIRAFDPAFAARQKRGFRGCFAEWLLAILASFEIPKADVFGGMTDGAKDVKGMVVDELKRPWEWCIPHMMNAATKWACGLTSDSKRSANPEITALIERLRVTIRQVRDVEQMGDLFEALCQLEGTSRTVKLVDYQSHRFLGLTASIERVLEKWNPLVAYYAECAKKPPSAKAPQAFLLKNDRLVLSQLLSLLKPIAVLKTFSQAEGPAQVKSLVFLYKIRQYTLDSKTHLRDYRSTATSPKNIPITDLEPVVVKTRALLAEALDTRFFSRYTEAAARAAHPYVFECQLFLHPAYKDLDDNLGKIVKYCLLQRSDDFIRTERISNFVKDQVKDRIRTHMRDARNGAAAADAAAANEANEAAAAAAASVLAELDRSFEVQMAGEVSMELGDLYGSVTTTRPVSDSEEGDSRIEEELLRWATLPAKRVDSILGFWEREATNFKLLSLVARSVYAFPSSSAQIERDFGDAGRMVTKERASIKKYKVEMSSFVRANRQYIDLTQCDKIPPEQRAQHIPKFMLADEQPADILPDIFSRCSVDEANSSL